MSDLILEKLDADVLLVATLQRAMERQQRVSLFFRDRQARRQCVNVRGVELIAARKAAKTPRGDKLREKNHGNAMSHRQLRACPRTPAPKFPCNWA